MSHVVYQVLTEEQIVHFMNEPCSMEEELALKAKVVHFLHNHPEKADREDRDWVYDQVIALIQQDDLRWA